MGDRDIKGGLCLLGDLNNKWTNVSSDECLVRGERVVLSPSPVGPDSVPWHGIFIYQTCPRHYSKHFMRIKQVHIYNHPETALLMHHPHSEAESPWSPWGCCVQMQEPLLCALRVSFFIYAAILWSGDASHLRATIWRGKGNLPKAQLGSRAGIWTLVSLASKRVSARPGVW